MKVDGLVVDMQHKRGRIVVEYDAQVNEATDSLEMKSQEIANGDRMLDSLADLLAGQVPCLDAEPVEMFELPEHLLSVALQVDSNQHDFVLAALQSLTEKGEAVHLDHAREPLGRSSVALVNVQTEALLKALAQGFGLDYQCRLIFNPELKIDRHEDRDAQMAEFFAEAAHDFGRGAA
jgi:hypothetical protein